MDSGYIADVILLDFTKPFHIISHSLLINKLNLLGIGGALLNWFLDFLTTRAMQMTVSGTNSKSRDVLSGVPQGSVLGPLLFLIYVNSLPSYIRSKYKFFTDDLKIYLKIRHNSHLLLVTDLNICQRDIDIVYKFAKS